GVDALAGELHTVARIAYFFFYQAEDGIRDWSVTGVQTCALPILSRRPTRSTSSMDEVERVGRRLKARAAEADLDQVWREEWAAKIGRASCRERVERSGVAGWIRKKERESDGGGGGGRVVVYGRVR